MYLFGFGWHFARDGAAATGRTIFSPYLGWWQHFLWLPWWCKYPVKHRSRWLTVKRVTTQWMHTQERRDYIIAREQRALPRCRGYTYSSSSQFQAQRTPADDQSQNPEETHSTEHRRIQVIQRKIRPVLLPCDLYHTWSVKKKLRAGRWIVQ